MIAGVDGCPAGWVVTMAPAWPPQQVCLAVCRDFAVVVATTAPCTLVVVDIPIGLPNPGQHRQCDVEARKILGRGAPRVFHTPPRELLEIPDYRAFAQRYRDAYGQGVSIQTFQLRTRLLDVDALMTPALQERIREYHPELVWRHLAGRLLPSKHTPEGLEIRRRLLQPHVPALDAVRPRRAKAAGTFKEHDLLDALVGLELAHRMTRQPAAARRLPSKPPRDARGLRMEIWY